MNSRDLRISVRTRTKMNYFLPLFNTETPTEDYYCQASDLAFRYNTSKNKEKDTYLSIAKLNACALLHYLYQYVITGYTTHTNTDFFSRTNALINKNHDCQEVISFYANEFPSPLLNEQKHDIITYTEENLRGFFLHQVMLSNPALVKAIKPLINPNNVTFPEATKALTALMGGYLQKIPNVSGTDDDLFAFLTRPSRLHPDSLMDQLLYILKSWKELIPPDIESILLNAIDFTKEEDKPHFFGNGGGAFKPETHVPEYGSEIEEYEAFTEDRNWMPNVVMVAKSTLVWLDQLSKFYERPITTLDQIPDEELDKLQERGFTALWLIGLWERSSASKIIKNLCGNPEAEASAYSLKSEQISPSIGGWAAIKNLKERCERRGIKLASDMVPNHTGIDSEWVINHPEYFIQQSYPPFPSYTYNGPDLSSDPNIEIKIEDHYYDQSDAAVTFRRVDKRTGDTRYIFHGNDGTSMPWNDTAQLDFLNPDTREAVFQQIRHVAQNFHIIRFDAAMTLAKKHIRRLWYPKPGQGGDIAGRAQHSMTDRDFDEKMPHEFWRDVVDRMADELPDTLLLAEAFWMMEGYFVRTLGMHRVYNSAFMNMLKEQENEKYQNTVKATIDFEPEILKRYVNFMSNPDEETAIGQFGDGDKYFGICTLLSTMPGLPMFGHGQIEGFHEKYGMEYRKAYWDEWPDEHLIEEHNRRIFPLLKKRYLYSGVENFQLYDLCTDCGVASSAFCYSNGTDSEKSLVMYNNQYEQVAGYIRNSADKLNKETGKEVSTTIAEALGLTIGGRRYLVYKNFSDNLYYLMPSLKVFEEGLFVALNGYETRVFTEMKEVEDLDGSYEKLYNMLNGQGVENMVKAIRFIRLEPVFKTLEALRKEQTLDIIKALLTGTSTKAENRKLALTLAETYAKLCVRFDSLPLATKALLPGEPEEIIPSEMLDLLSHFATVIQESTILSHLAPIMDELPVIIAGAFILQPFVSEETTIEGLLAGTDRMMLSSFFKEALEKSNFKSEDIIQACHGSALLLLSHQYMGDKEDTALAKLLEKDVLWDYTSCNTYENTVWFKKESMQDLIVLSGLSEAIFSDTNFDSVKYIEKSLQKENISEYKLETLLN